MIGNNKIKKKNILVFTSTFPLSENDPVSARFVFDLSSELTKYFNVYVLAPHFKGAKFHEKRNSLNIIRYPYFLPLSAQKLSDGRGILPNFKSNPLAAILIPFFFASQIVALLYIIKRKKIDLVNSHWMVPQGLSFALIQYFVKCKHVLTVHAADLFFLKRIIFGKLLANYIVKYTDICLFVSNYNHHCLKELIGTNMKNKIVPMGVHTSVFYPTDNKTSLREKHAIKAKYVLLFVGKFTPKKGIIYLIKALEKIVAVKKDILLILVGSGYLEDELKSTINRINLEDKVLFLGSQKHDILKEYYQISDIIVIPSIIDEHGETEGVPVVLLESLASGKPVIGTNVGGIPEILEDGYNGLIVRQKDSEDLFEKIISLLEGNNLKRIEENALKSGKKYDWSLIGKLYTNQFKIFFKS